MAFVELKTNRTLLDYKFEGYKLSLDSLPVLKLPVSGGVTEYRSTTDEYSYLQLHMSSHFNHLFQDLWSPSSVFYISQKQLIFWTCLLQDGHLASPRIVWKIPADDEPKANSAIVFPSSDWAMVSNGHSRIYLLHTVSRNAGEPWMLCHHYVLSECLSTSYLLHGVHMALPGRQQIDCLVAHFRRTNDTETEKGNKKPPFSCLLEWLSFTCGQDGQEWRLKRTRRLEGSSALLYVALEKSCDAVYLASETDFRLVYDSDRPLEPQPEEDNKENAKELSLYTYIQTPEDITVVFRLPERASKSDVQVQFSTSKLEVLWRGQPVLKGQLENPIDIMSSTWVICGERLELILSKAEIGLMWRELIKGDKRGEELMDPALVEEIHSQLAHLTSETQVGPTYGPSFSMNQLEECDSCADILTFLRIDGNTHKETHRVNIGGHQFLFTMQPCPESLPVICLRHDVDGVVWQPKNTSSEGELDQFRVEHTATFSALGYVQASKQDRKFASCSSDFGFAVISDCNRHIYIYCQPVSLNSSLELRNRRTGESVSHVAKQYVVNLENCYEILGLQVSSDCIFVLSSNMLYAIKVHPQ